jgi:hypothetical protein
MGRVVNMAIDMSNAAKEFVEPSVGRTGFPLCGRRSLALQTVLANHVTGRLKRDHLWAPLVPFEIGGLRSSGFA